MFILLFTKASAPIVLTLLGIVTEVRLFTANALAPIDSTVSGIRTLTSPLPTNAELSIFTTSISPILFWIVTSLIQVVLYAVILIVEDVTFL